MIFFIWDALWIISLVRPFVRPPPRRRTIRQPPTGNYDFAYSSRLTSSRKCEKRIARLTATRGIHIQTDGRRKWSWEVASRLKIVSVILILLQYSSEERIHLPPPIAIHKTLATFLAVCPEEGRESVARTHTGVVRVCVSAPRAQKINHKRIISHRFH